MFGLFCILLIMLLQAVVSILIKGRSLTGHDNLEQTSGIDADLVLLGSSRCWAHFDPLFFDSTFNVKTVNIGVDGHSEVTMAIVRLMDYLARNKAPRYAILSFDPFMEAGSITDNDNFVHKNNFARYAFLFNKKDEQFVNYFKFNFYEKYIPLYAVFKYKLLSDILFKNDINRWFEYGYEAHDEVWDTLSRPVTNINRKFYFTQSSIPSVAKSLRDFTQLCHDNGIKLLCIQTPVYKVIYDSTVFSETKKICKRLQIPFVDVAHLNMMDSIKYFYNSNHLNKSGVHEMNEFLRSDSTLNQFFNK